MGLRLSSHPIHPGKEPLEDRSGRRGQQTGGTHSWPKDALGPFPPEGLSMGVPRAHDCRTLTRKAGWVRRGLHSIGGGLGRGWEEEEEEEVGCWRGRGCFLALSARSPWSWEEEEEQLGT